MNPLKLIAGMFSDPKHYAKAWGFLGPLMVGWLVSLGLSDGSAAQVVQGISGLLSWWLGTGLANAPAKNTL